MTPINKELAKLSELLQQDAHEGKFKDGDLVLEEVGQGTENHHTRITILYPRRPRMKTEMTTTMNDWKSVISGIDPKDVIHVFLDEVPLGCVIEADVEEGYVIQKIVVQGVSTRITRKGTVRIEFNGNPVVRVDTEEARTYL